MPSRLALLLCATFACRQPTGFEHRADAGSPGKADDAHPSLCNFAERAEVARGILWLAEHAAFEELTHPAPEGAELAPEIANAIVDQRPFESITELEAQLDATGCARLEDMACDRLGRCEDVVDVATWNLQHFPLAAQTSLEVTSALRLAHADLIGLQEIDSVGAFYAMRNAMPEYYGFVGREGFDTRVAILYRTERFEVVDIEDLFEDDSYAFPRPPLAVTFALRGRARSEQLTVVVVHLKAMLDQASVERRRLAIERLAAWHAERGPRPVLFVGDFNDRIDDPPEEDVFGGFRTEDYHILTTPLAEQGSFSYIRFESLIDHSVVTREAETILPTVSIEALPLEQEIADYESRVSDHRPVISQHLPILPVIESRLSNLPW